MSTNKEISAIYTTTRKRQGGLWHFKVLCERGPPEDSIPKKCFSNVFMPNSTNNYNSNLIEVRNAPTNWIVLLFWEFFFNCYEIMI